MVHHIVDPATGLSANGPWRTATVAAASCAEANAASTAALVAGHEAVAWLEAERFAARLVGLDGAVRLLGSWPEEEGGHLDTPVRRMGGPVPRSRTSRYDPAGSLQ
ncbi:MAG: FAD:protein FMN transferase [Acidimicrobiales bacterium]|jgi:thiamine biosynthesis lipoprotein